MNPVSQFPLKNSPQKNDAIRLSKRGLTVLEFIIVIIIVSVLASLALPRFFILIERSRTVEAIEMLGRLRRAQLFHKDVYGTYVDSSTPNALSVLNIEPPQLIYWQTLEPLNCVALPYCCIGHIFRKGSEYQYHIHIEEKGGITCGGISPPGICQKLGLDSPYY